MSSSERQRVFATVIYPESAPENFREIVESWHVEAFLSPLHDKDVNPTGEMKKAHYHLLVRFSGMKSVEQVKVLFMDIRAVGIEKVQSFIGMARYLCHLDNPEKAQYEKKDVLCFSGIDYYETIEKSADVLNTIKEMSRFVLKNDIFTLGALFEYADNENKEDWIRVLTMKSTLWFTALVKSNAYEKQKLCHGGESSSGKKLMVDMETGEIEEIIKN